MTSSANPIFLPGAEDAVIPPSKLRDYALNPDHATGRHKARVFASELGLGREDWQYLAAQVAARVRTTPVTRIDVDIHGTRYELIVTWTD
jgi:uncharacterized protein DUF6883